MKTCGRCNTELRDDALFCSDCGARLSEQDQAKSVDDDRSIEALLAAANLHRMRGEWDEAEDCCARVLAREPDNPAAQALLGEIYASQGKLEEAVRWFEMAVETAPDSKPYAERLEKLREDLTESYSDSDTSTSRLAWFDRFVIGQSFESSIRIITVTSAAFAALLIAAGLIALLSHKQPSVSATDYTRPTTRPGDRHRPVVFESSPSPDLKVPRAAYEIRLLRQMNESPLVTSRRITVDDARVDPRARVLIATFRNRSNGSDRRETLLNAGAVAAAGFTMNPDIAYVTVRCVGLVRYPTGRELLDLVFVADVARQSASALQPNATSDQIGPVMQLQWWNALAR